MCVCVCSVSHNVLFCSVDVPVSQMLPVVLRCSQWRPSRGVCIEVFDVCRVLVCVCVCVLSFRACMYVPSIRVREVRSVRMCVCVCVCVCV